MDRTLEVKTMDNFWNVWVEGTHGGSRCKHETLKAARQEAERLARMTDNRGRKVYVLECVGYWEVPEVLVEWTTLKEGGK